MTFERRLNRDGVIVKLDLLHSDVSDMKDAIKNLTNAVARLAILEERLSNTTTSIERAFNTMTQMETRIKALEQLTPITSQNNRWVEKSMFAIVGAFLLYMTHKLGIA